jgi:hypothetical protein
MTKYWVIEGSATGHCCFTYSVVSDNYHRNDTEKKYPRSEGEFFDAESAEIFAAAMNEKARGEK